MLLPVVYLVIRSTQVGASFWELVARPRTVAVLGRTILLASSVTAASVAISAPLAWLLTRTDLPGRRIWSVLTVLPLAIPSLVGGFTFVAAFGTGGIAPRWLESALNIQFPEIYGFFGAWALLTLLSYPYVLLPVRSALAGMDPMQEEAARSLGHSPASVFFRVVLPNVRHAILAGSLLTALYTMSDFAAVSLLQFDSFTRAIYVQYQGSFNRNYAAVLALILVLLTLVILALESRARGRASYYRIGTGTRKARAPVRLGRWRWPAFSACLILVLLGVGVPIGVVIFWLVRGVTHGESILVNWSSAFNSVWVSFVAAAITVLAALPIALWSVRFPSGLARWTERAAFVGYALPGIVVALALVFFGARYGGSLYQSIWMLLFAYVVLFLPQALGAVKGTLVHVGPNVENVARTLGHSPLKVLFYVTLPMVWPGALAGGALVFLTVMKELPATLLLSPIGFTTLVTDIWSGVSEAFYARAAAPSLLLIAASSLSLYVILKERK